MSVIKCSNCENEILDTEIVCPYCDCPISETIKKMKSADLETYSSKSIDDLTGKIPSVEEEKTEAKKDVTMGQTVKIAVGKDLKKLPLKDEKEPKEEKDGKKETLSDTDKFKKLSDSKKNTKPEKKATDKKSKDKKIVFIVTLVGIIIVAALIWSVSSYIADVYQKKEKPNKTVKITSSAEIETKKELGYELHSSTLTITDDKVMLDYDSPSDTPWFADKDKIKHVTFGKKVTRIGAHSFEGFDSITDINISDSVIEIGESAFTSCSSLTKITNMSKNIEEIDDYAFTGCSKLSQIPGYTEEADFEPTIERVGMEAFKSCKALENFKLPMYTRVDTDAFYGHGDDFALICEPGSEAHKYASTKGIPTKLSFDGQAAQPVDTQAEENPATTEPKNEEKPSAAETQKPNNNSGTPAQGGSSNQGTSNTAPQGSSQTQGSTPNQGSTANQGSNPNQPASSAPTMNDLQTQLKNAQTQAEKDQILKEIDKLIQ